MSEPLKVWQLIERLQRMPMGAEVHCAYPVDKSVDPEFTDGIFEVVLDFEGDVCLDGVMQPGQIIQGDTTGFPKRTQYVEPKQVKVIKVKMPPGVRLAVGSPIKMDVGHGNIVDGIVARYDEFDNADIEITGAKAAPRGRYSSSVYDQGFDFEKIMQDMAGRWGKR